MVALRTERSRRKVFRITTSCFYNKPKRMAIVQSNNFVQRW